MKKTILTLGLISFFAISAHAQDSKTKKDTKTNTEKAPSNTEQVAAPAVNDDGTLVSEPNNSVKKEETPKTTKKSRMAINQKGTPASSKTDSKKEDSNASGNPK